MDEGSRAVESVNGIRHWILDFQMEEWKQAVLRMTPMTGNYIKCENSRNSCASVGKKSYTNNVRVKSKVF